jgi:large subunit ribosomal protein L7/L12
MAALTNDQILDAIASMTVLEVSELVKAMEEKFGVTAAVAVAAGPAAAGGAAAARGTRPATADFPPPQRQSSSFSFRQ